MTKPLPDTETPARERQLDRVARKWAYLVSMTSFVPLPHNEIEQRMRELAHEVFAAAETEPPDVERAASVGQQLVELHCVGKASLRSSIDVLAGALLEDERLLQAGGVGERVARTIGAMAAGYADTVRWHTVEQQDGLNQALMEAVRKSERSLADREAECAEALTELSLLRSQLNHQLLHDVLTALPNRQFFTTRLEHVLNTGRPTSVYRLELAGLATIRDGLGREAAGLLRIVAGRLSTAVAEKHAMVAHFGEGHFAILAEATAPDPTPVIEALRTALAEPAYVDGRAVAVSASIGVVQSPPYRDDPVTLLHAADLALRKAKHAGPGRWTLLEPNAVDGDLQELRLAATLLDAWQSGRVHIGFRPQVGISGTRPVRFDALVRWEHTTLGTLPHERCVALAERMDLGERLGQWFLDRAAERLLLWPGEPPLTVMVPPSFATDPELPAIVRRSDIAPERLQVSVPAGLTSAAADNLTRLADAGVSVAVHDFDGAVTCLADVPVQAVRLAPDLVRRSAEPLVGHAVRDLAALVHQAGATVVVDGIGSDAEVDRWRDLGADVATGPLFTDVEPVEDF